MRNLLDVLCVLSSCFVFHEQWKSFVRAPGDSEVSNDWKSYSNRHQRTVPLQKDPWIDDRLFWLLLPVTWTEFPGLRRWCHKDETEFSAGASNSEGPRRDFEQRTDNTHTHTHTHTEDWLTAAESLELSRHTYRERTWESKSPSVNVQSEQVILIKLLRVITRL